MNIAMILDEEFRPDPRVQNEANALIDAGHTVSLFCLDYQNPSKIETIGEIRVFRYKASRIIYSLSSLAYTFPFYRWFLQPKLKKFFAQIKYDAIHVHDMRIAKAVLKAQSGKNVHMILDLHENRPEIMKYYEHVRRFPGNLLIYPKIWKKWEKTLVNAYHKIVVVTKEAKKYLMDIYSLPEKKIIVFPNTVDPEFFSEFVEFESIIQRFKSSYMIFYFGDTGKRRGLETAIKAIKILKKSIPEILLVIAGKSKYDKQLKSLVKKLQLENVVSFEGFQDIKKLPSYILASNVCISPLHRNIHHDTTFANKIFQYMSLGKPVLVSNCTAQENILNDAGAGLVHEAEKEMDFAEKILNMYHNPDKAKTMGDHGKNFVRNHFNQKTTSLELVRFYNKLSKS